MRSLANSSGLPSFGLFLRRADIEELCQPFVWHLCFFVGNLLGYFIRLALGIVWAYGTFIKGSGLSWSKASPESFLAYLDF
jgi:hypothetical protein